MESSKYSGEHTACPCNLRGRPRPNVIFDRMSEDLDPSMRGAAILREEAPFVIRHGDCQQEETETAAMANELPSAFEPLCCNGVQLSIRQPHFTLPLARPIDSPWDIEQTSARNLDEIGTSMNLDDFIPLDELLEASLQSLDSTCSDRTTFQVASAPLASVESSMSSFQPPSPGASFKEDSAAIKSPPPAPPRARKRKLLLPANTRKINREAQQRFRLKQKQRQQEISDEVDKLKAENTALLLKVRELEALLQT